MKSICRLFVAHILPTNAELASFVEQARRDRPVAWAAVERLKRACRSQQPLTPKDSAALDVVLGEPIPVTGRPLSTAANPGLQSLPCRLADGARRVAVQILRFTDVVTPG